MCAIIISNVAFTLQSYINLLVFTKLFVFYMLYLSIWKYERQYYYHCNSND